MINNVIKEQWKWMKDMSISDNNNIDKLVAQQLH